MARSYRLRLSQLLEVLGPNVLSAGYLPDDTDLRVVEPIVYDPHDTLPEQPDGLLLGVGVQEDTPEAVHLVEEAGQRGYRAIAIKDRGTAAAGMADAARKAGVALLLAPSGLAWRHLDALVTAALSVPGSAAASYASVGMGDLFSLANAIAAAIGGATSVEDQQGNVLAYSTLPGQETDEIRKQAILGRKTPARPTNRVEYSRVFRAEGTVRFASLGEGHSPRLAVAVRAGNQLLGYLWVLDGSPPVVPKAEELLEDAARLAALHLLHARTPSNPRRQQRAETLRALLDGDVSETVAVDRLDLAPESECAVVAFSAGEPGSQPGGVAAARVLDLITISAEGWHEATACTTSRGRVYALLPMAKASPALLRRFVEETTLIVRTAAQLPLCAGIGPRARLCDVPAARRLADLVVDILVDAAGQGVASEEEFRSQIALIKLAEHGAATSDLLEPVRRMIEHDRSHDTSHAETLLEYLNAFGDVAKAASGLFVHENTLRYRIRRVQETFGVNLSDPADRLVTWLQLRLLLGDTRRSR